MRIEDIEYEADGLRMVGYLAVDDLRPGPRPAVLVCHEGPGLEEGVKGRTVRLAAEGYCAFALDYQGDGTMHPPERFGPRFEQLSTDPARTRLVARAGLDVLLAQPEADGSRIGAVGFCFGGTMAVELARSGSVGALRAVAGLHPGMPLPDPEATARIGADCSVLLCVGADDPLVPVESAHAFADELRAAGVADWRIEVHGSTGHSFTNPQVDELGMPGLAYQADADRRAWRSVLELLQERLTPT